VSPPGDCSPARLVGQGLASAIEGAEDADGVDRAFNAIFGVVAESSSGLSLGPIDSMLEWISESARVSRLHPEVMMTAIRLTYPLRQELQNWERARDSISEELRGRNVETERLLLVLSPAGGHAEPRLGLFHYRKPDPECACGGSGRKVRSSRPATRMGIDSIETLYERC